MSFCKHPNKYSDFLCFVRALDWIFNFLFNSFTQCICTLYKVRHLFLLQKVGGSACLPSNNTDYWVQKLRTNFPISKTYLRNLFGFLQRKQTAYMSWIVFSILDLLCGLLLTFLALIAKLRHLSSNIYDVKCASNVFLEDYFYFSTIYSYVNIAR